MATKNSIFTSVISGSPTITSEKLIGRENYLSWSASVELWFMGLGYEDHLITPEDAIPSVDKVHWKKIDAQLCSALWQSVDPKILLHLRAYKTCSKFWNQAKALYTNDIQRLYKVTSAIVNIRILRPSEIRFLAVHQSRPWMMCLLASSVSPPHRLCYLIAL